MANLVSYFANGTHSGSKENIWVQIVFFINVGSGQITDFGSFAMTLLGHIVRPIQKELSISVHLTDSNPGAMEGPCVVKVNEWSDENARYKVEGNKLHLACKLEGADQSIYISQIYGGKQTEVGLSGKLGYLIHLDPA